MEALKVVDLSFEYPEAESEALKNVSFSLEAGSFNVLCGATGSGKSTLLRLLKRELAPVGKRSGSIIIGGKEQSELDERESVAKIGFVMQSPEAQIVCDKVWHELVFTLESLGADKLQISVRAAETASYFGISDIYDSDTALLSGGQKQLLNLASVMMTDPELLILDEPTAQLDPIAAHELIMTVRRLCDEQGVTVLMSEHRLEETVPLCDRLIVMDNGIITHDGEPGDVIRLLDEKSPVMPAMPAPARVFRGLDISTPLPLTVAQGRRLITGYKNDIRKIERPVYTHSDRTALEFKNVYFRYERNTPDILCGLDLKVYEGEIFCILGANGSGKSTAVNAAAGLIRPYSGQISVFGKKLKEYKNRSLYKECLTLLPQEVQTSFIKSTVKDELEVSGVDIDKLPFDLSQHLSKHPYDLSGGEQQLLGLAKALGTKPRLLLLDEVTKGMDAALKLKTAHILKSLKDSGITCVLVTHDIEFSAICGDRCAMLFNGEAVCCMTPDRFFGQSSYYTTAACKLSRGHYDNAVTVEDVVALARRNGRA